VTSRHPALGAALVVLAAICFGTLGPLTRFADAAGVESLTIVTWRAALGAGAMLVLLMARGATGHRVASLRAIPRGDRWFVVAGALANSFLNLAMFIAFVRIDIGLALLVFYSYPAFVAVASVAWFGVRLDALRWSALFVSLAGLALTLTGAGGIGQLDALGIGLAFAAALTQAFYVMAARHGFAHIPGVESAALTMGGAGLVYLVIAGASGSFAGLSQPLAATDALVPVILAGLVGAAIPTLSWIVGIRLLGAPRAAILATLEPVVGVGLAAWLLGEQPAPIQLVGGALILTAAVLLQLRPSAAVTADHEAIAASGHE
jgi:drug/metabolite transporter (DMT)-like permease